jgi:hypothetical protein
MLQAAGLAIAFNPIDEAVIGVSHKVIRSKNIADILDVILEVEDGV